MVADVFHEEYDANDMTQRVFQRVDMNSTKYGHESGMFCLRMNIFLQKLGM